MIAFVLSVIFSFTLFGSILNVLLSMSTNTGFAFCMIIGEAVAMNEKGVVITSSPSFMFRAFSAVWIAAVPEFSAAANFVPHRFENFSSNSFTLLPCAIMPLSRTSKTLSFSF